MKTLTLLSFFLSIAIISRIKVISASAFIPSGSDGPPDPITAIKKGGRGLLGGLSGSFLSASNAFGQTMSNYGGDTFIGGAGKKISNAAKFVAGGIKYQFFSGKNPKTPVIVTPETLGETSFKPEEKLYVIIHGYTMGGYFEKPADNLVSLLKIKDGLLRNELGWNIILVDWTSLSSDMTYMFSSTGTGTVADDLSDFLIAIKKLKLIKSFADVHLIGHSLGGQTCGITGTKITEKTGEKVGRIDAIDPAGPNFDSSPSIYQLGPRNGEFVQAIHCNIKTFGSVKDRAMADFYPNGGDDLPGCESFPLKKDICNHVRCNDLYVETMSDVFTGCKCETYKRYIDGECDCSEINQARMGFHILPTAKQGAYYLNITHMSSAVQGPNPNLRSKTTTEAPAE